ncbi:hypothetical protein CFK41_11975 [Brachybacterium ginsengisoli]|uniref:DUF4233 domain-containing protein n=1 Tax=Brachybacterium ginsengisoli TaxID=1331682 RepID=A0A291GYX7_9MICO|nr:DUF4233 domain-containing protein [Brachybacterium ginsengisoli]ATG55405.1 hypothetical protein CFK41_11975 [Brachybacterium ginsengisoli]
MDLDLTPSPRPHGAQRMFSATILVIEAFVVFFAVLAAHQLVPEDRVLTWVWGLLTVLALLLCSGMLRRGAWPYWLGLLLQLPVILLGLQVTPMWVVGLGFAALYAYGAFKGHRLDQEKDAVDASVLASRAREDSADGSTTD